MKQYKSLDVAKFIAAVLIVILHTAPFSSYSKALTFGFRNVVTVIAVPFFFATSGFLLFKKYDTLDAEERKQYIHQYLKRLVVMYLIWSAVYFGFVVVRWLRKGFTIAFVLEYIKDFFFEGSYSTIWFLPALISAVAIVALLHQKFSHRTIFLISCFIYIFTLGGSSYYGLVTKVPALANLYGAYYTFFDSIKNGLCFGMIFIALGAHLSEVKTEKWSLTKAFAGAVLCGCLLAIEEFMVAWMGWNSRGVDTVIMLVPLTYFLMKFVLMLELNISSQKCAMLRKLSILMFLCQRIPISVIDMFMADSIISRNSMLYFLTVLAVTLMLSVAILKGSEKYRILKKLF